jgi:hypothetical protein
MSMWLDLPVSKCSIWCAALRETEAAKRRATFEIAPPLPRELLRLVRAAVELEQTREFGQVVDDEERPLDPLPALKISRSHSVCAPNVHVRPQAGKSQVEHYSRIFAWVGSR